LSKFQEKNNCQHLQDTLNELTGFRKKPSVPISVLAHKGRMIGDKCRMHDLLAEELTAVPHKLPDYFSVSKTVGSYSGSFVYRYNYL
jgi:hypothetical protein